jgi:(E)-4-hydroxy-3-methylbut-2-enyl-diphosphate synthase
METLYNDTFFCNNLSAYSRLKTKVVHVGHVPLGGLYPVRIQSMTNTNTLDTEATVAQCIRIFEAGADYVRITAPGIPEAENLANIKKMLLQKGYRNPLIADIHFNPQAAEIAAKYVEKIRINPGNYVDKRLNKQVEFTDEDYKGELERIRERLLPLIKICKEYKTAIRIGVNHGSLSGRIVSKYGDTPKGMVESAMEFIRIFAAEDFHELVISMKASNTRVMVQSTRLLVNYMFREGLNYPIHLGVTEAGDGEDGRVRSSAGTGTLLSDGIGDTIRVSLTEDPEAEIPVARMLVDQFTNPSAPLKVETAPDVFFTPFEYNKRKTNAVALIGGSHQPVVIASELALTDKVKPDFIYSNEKPAQLPALMPFTAWNEQTDKSGLFPVFEAQTFLTNEEFSRDANFCLVKLEDLTSELLEKIRSTSNTILVINELEKPGFATARSIIELLVKNAIEVPVIVRRTYNEPSSVSLSIKASADMGGLFIDGLVDGIWLENNVEGAEAPALDIAFGILQAARLRMSKTEYISCPSCGRTLFDLQEVTAKVKAKTNHLKGLKIGIMGCIVNGPGEMADADYGYVGAGVGKVSLYKGKEVIIKGMPQEEAVDALVNLIKENGDWKDPE